MSDLGNYRAQQQARHRAGGSDRTNAYGEVINRYLGSFSYADPYAPPAPHVPPAPAPPAGTVVVGVDDLPNSHVVTDLAAIEAELSGAALLIVHAGVPARDDRLLRRLTGRVHEFAPEVPVSGRVTAGAGAVEVLLAEAAATDLLVVGHRHGAARGVLGRSVADRVAARHPGPVLVVREAGWPPGPELAARPLVAGVEGSAASRRAAEFAVREAGVRGCDVVQLRVAAQPGETPDRTELVGAVRVRNRTVAGNPAEELVSASAHAAAIVVGRAPGRTRLGPVSRALLHHAHCPVFLVG
ncbi:universal stress protein [Actinoplanes siamensis]|uniref:Universal stress protein n=1 Tax=Actinoplanes siamensis TaxID=1223317 RepID=A0A919KDL1_9ACTN|nr:universal stress protein [Actinoplanes siamensis]GIF02702.1 universal stress protein [Actinoplanes siamensis]